MDIAQICNTECSKNPRKNNVVEVFFSNIVSLHNLTKNVSYHKLCHWKTTKFLKMVIP